MPYPSMQSAAQRVRRCAITIPGSGGVAVTLQSLVEAALEVVDPGWTSRSRAKIMGGRVGAPAATYTAGDGVSDLPRLVAIGESYSEPALDFLSATYVKASAIGPIAVTVSVYLTGYDR